MGWGKREARGTALWLLGLCASCEVEVGGTRESADDPSPTIASDDGVDDALPPTPQADASHASRDAEHDQSDAMSAADASDDEAESESADASDGHDSSGEDAASTVSDAGTPSLARDAGDAALLGGVGSLSAQLWWGLPGDAGARPVSSVAFTRRPVDDGCARQVIGGCTIERCGGAPAAGEPLELSAGRVQVRGSRGSCVWDVDGAPGSELCAKQLWDLDLLGEQVRFSGSGGEFPAFDVALMAPLRFTVSAPQPSARLLRQAGLQFRWLAPGAPGVIEVTLRRTRPCPGAPAALTVSARCSENAQKGALAIPSEVFSALAVEPCLAATVSQRVRHVESMHAFTLSTELVASFEPPYPFVAPNAVCSGTHAACNTFASDTCSRHGCRWQSKRCTGTPHACSAIALSECSAALGHAGCNIP